jgi:outer membrane protein TolC
MFFISYSAAAQYQGLDLYIQQGLKNSPLLKDYANQLQLSSIDSAVLNAERKPQVNGIGMLLVDPTYNGWGYDQAVTNTGNYLAVANISQNVFTKNIYAPQYEALTIEKQSITNTSKLSEHDLMKAITDQYITAYSSFNLISYTQSTYKLLKEEEMLLQKFVQSGVYKQTDYLSFEIAVQSQEIQLWN